MFLPGELHLPCGITVLSSTGLEQKLEAALQVGSHEDSFPPSSHTSWGSAAVTPGHCVGLRHRGSLGAREAV